jgi:hypothetical protein
LTVIAYFLIKSTTVMTVMIGTNSFVILIVFGPFLDDTYILGKLMIVNELRFSDSKLHLDDIFLNIPSCLKHLNFELIDRVQVLFSKINHLPLHLSHKFVHDHAS